MSQFLSGCLLLWSRCTSTDCHANVDDNAMCAEAYNAAMTDLTAKRTENTHTHSAAVRSARPGPPLM